MTAERTADFNRVADLGNIVEEGGDFTLVEALDGDLVKPLQPRRRRNRVASLCLIAIRCGKPDVDVLASPKGTPVPGSKEEALHPLRLALDPLDHGLLPWNVKRLGGRFHHGQSPE